MKDAISAAELGAFHSDFRSDRANIVAMNAVTNKGLNAVALNPLAVRAAQHEYSVNLPQHGITNQKQSGRCWMFAGLNLLREKLIYELNLEDFEFSAAYLTFYDKLEKANLFLEDVIENIDEPLDGRVMSHLLHYAAFDGGWWCMFVALVEKYGLVPKTAVPETAPSENSGAINQLLAEKLRGFARDLKKAREGGADAAALREAKAKMLPTIYRMLVMAYGVPVRAFDWEIRTKDGRFISEKGITPAEFRDKYVHRDFNVVELMAGSSDGAEAKKYILAGFGNVIEGAPMQYVSVSVEDLKRAAIAQLKDGKPVYFGCDVLERSNTDMGILDTWIYEYGQLFGTQFNMTKAERFGYGQASVSHAMLLKGVDLDKNGNPIRWRVENSWGDTRGEKGMFLMENYWFDEYVYDIVVEPQYIQSEAVLAAWNSPEATVLAPWIMPI